MKPQVMVLTLLPVMILSLAGALRPATAHWEENGNPVCAAARDQRTPRIAPDGAGGAIIAWYDGRVAWDAYAQRIDANGSPLWTIDGVSLCTVYGDHYNPQPVSDGAGGGIFVWQEYRGGWEIYAQHVGGDGTVLWSTGGVAVCAYTGYQMRPNAIPDGAGGAIVAWQDFRQVTQYDIYAQHVNAWGTSEPIATAFASAYAEIENGCVLLSWQVTKDASVSSFEIERSEAAADGEFSAVDAAISELSSSSFSCTDCSAQAGKTYWYRIVYAGESGEAACEPMRVSMGPAVAAYALRQNHPNPFNPSCTITYEIPMAGRVTLTVFDAQGSLVATLVDGWRGEGVHSKAGNRRRRRSPAFRSLLLQPVGKWLLCHAEDAAP